MENAKNRIVKLIRQKPELALFREGIPIGIDLICYRIDETNDLSDYKKVCLELPLTGILFLQIINCENQKLMALVAGKILSLYEKDINNLNPIYCTRTLCQDLISLLNAYGEGRIGRVEYQKKHSYLQTYLLWEFNNQYRDLPPEKHSRKEKELKQAVLTGARLDIGALAVDLVIWYGGLSQNMVWEFDLIKESDYDRIKAILEEHTTKEMYQF